MNIYNMQQFNFFLFSTGGAMINYMCNSLLEVQLIFYIKRTVRSMVKTIGT